MERGTRNAEIYVGSSTELTDSKFSSSFECPPRRDGPSGRQGPDIRDMRPPVGVPHVRILPTSRRFPGSLPGVLREGPRRCPLRPLLWRWGPLAAQRPLEINQGRALRALPLFG